MAILHRLHIAASLLALVIILGLVSCSDNPCEPCDAIILGWQLEPDSMNLAILVLDFQTYTFEGGNLSYYPACSGCGADSLPFQVEYKGPHDFGSVLFQYTAAGDTLFAATIVWMGTGEIHYPTAWTPPDSFCSRPEKIIQPSEVQRFQFYPRLAREKLIAKTDSAWAAISSLDIVHAFAKDSFRVGYYFYPPTVGMFDPAVAKWIIFLYRGNSR